MLSYLRDEKSIVECYWIAIRAQCVCVCVLCKHFGFCFGAIFHVKLGVLTNRTWYQNIYFCGWTVRSPRIQIQPKSIRIGEYETHNKLTKAKAKRTGFSLVAHLHFFECCINISTRSSYLMSALQIYIYYPSGDIVKAVLCMSIILLRFQVMLWFR